MMLRFDAVFLMKWVSYIKSIAIVQIFGAACVHSDYRHSAYNQKVHKLLQAFD